jgi:hypothetical protein
MIREIVTKHYRGCIWRQLHKFLGGGDFVDGSVGLMKNLGVGVHDLFYEPIDGVLDDDKTFIDGLSKVLAPDGKAYIEFHYAPNLHKHLHYDYIYHEHIFYFTLLTMINLLEKHALYAFDAFKSPISGGSLVVVASKKRMSISSNLEKFINDEKKQKINSHMYWRNFKQKCNNHKISLIKLINSLLKKNKKLAGYGASARSSTLLNYCKINNKHLDFVFDKSDMKHNLFTSGSNIKIRKPEIKIIKSVDCIVILAWNFKDEIIKYLKKIKFSGILITVLPRIKIFKC